MKPALKTLFTYLFILFVIGCAILLSVPARAQSFALNESSGNYTPSGEGMNIGTNDYYSQITLKNLASVNPSMQQELTNIPISVSAGSSSSFTDSNAAGGVYANQFAGGTWVFACEGSSFTGSVQNCGTAGGGSNVGLSGSITSNTTGGVFTVTGLNVAPSAGDTIWVYSSPTATTPSAMQNFNGLGWSGTYSIDTNSGDLVSGTSQCIELGNGGNAGTVLDSGSLGPNYVFLSGHTFTQSISVKLLSGSGTLTASVNRSGGINASHAFTVSGSGYQTYSYTFSGSESTSTGANTVVINWAYSGSGDVCLNNSQLTDGTDTDATFRNQFTTDLITVANVPEIRYSWPVNGDTLANLTNANQSTRRTAVGEGNSEIINPMSFDWYNTLRWSLANNIKTVWLNIPLTMLTATNAQNISDYLCGGSGTTYGAIRIAQGQTTPWCSEFRIVLELGNEVWNGATGNFYLPQYAVGGNSAWNYVPIGIAFAEEFKAAASYSSTMKISMGTQTANGGFWGGLIHSNDTTNAVDIDGINEYGMFSATNCSTQQLFQSATTEAWANAFDASSASGFYQSAAVSGFVGGVYEGQNSSTFSTTCSTSQLTGLPEGEGYALTDTLMPLLASQKFGIQDWDFFVLYEHDFNTGAHDIALWGGFTGPGGAYNNPRPAAYAEGMVNTCSVGGTGYAATGSSIPTLSYTGGNGVNNQSAVPLLQAFAFKNGSNRCIVVENTDYSNSHTFSLTGTTVPSGTVTVTTLTAGATNDTNETANTAPTVAPSTTIVTNPTSFTLAAHSVESISWSTGAFTPAPITITGSSITIQGNITIP